VDFQLVFARRHIVCAEAPVRCESQHIGNARKLSGLAGRGILNTLKLMLRLGRSFHAQVSDPDFPLRLFATEVAGKLHQLEKSWEMIQDPMKDSEADAILQQAFPDEPRTGSAA